MDVTRVRDIIRLCEENMTVFGGIMGYESFLNGAKGWVSVGSNIMPNEFSKLFDFSVNEKNIDKARKIYSYILPILELESSTNSVTSKPNLSKYLLNSIFYM